MADARNFATWDPGVSSSVLVEGDEPGLGAAYDVRVTGTTLRYETTEFDGPDRVVLHADSTILSSSLLIWSSTSASCASTAFFDRLASSNRASHARSNMVRMTPKSFFVGCMDLRISAKPSSIFARGIDLRLDGQPGVSHR